MSKEQIIKLIIDELQKVNESNYLMTVYLFISKFNARDDN